MYNCFGKHNFNNFMCRRLCYNKLVCEKVRVKLAFCKRAPIAYLTQYLTDNEPLVREAAKERFDELSKI